MLISLLRRNLTIKIKTGCVIKIRQSRLVLTGEGVSTPIPIIQPNDASVLYEDGDFMLRMLTLGRFSPDGQTGVRPDEYERYFRIRATGTDGSTVHIEQVGAEYQVQGGSLRVIGLSDLGQAEGGFILCLL